MGETTERHVGRFPRLLRYPFKFRGDVHGGLRLRHLSLQRFHDTVPPFAPWGPLGWFPHFLAHIAALRLPGAPASLCFRSSPRFHLAVEASGPPRFLGNPPVHAPLSDPGRDRCARPSGPCPSLGAAMLPSMFSTMSAPATISISRLNHAAY